MQLNESDTAHKQYKPVEVDARQAHEDEIGRKGKLSLFVIF